ncbi:MAG: hypothetical protein ACKVQR_00330 [Aquabacterium sp.]
MPLRFVLYVVVFVAVALLIGLLVKRMVVGDRIDGPPEVVGAATAAPGAAALAAARPAPPNAPIEMRLATTTVWSTVAWMVVLALGSVLLFSQPDVLWTRWLTWTVAVVLALLSALAALFVWSEARSRVVASASGLEWHNGLSLQKRITWAEVGSVRLVEHWTKTSGSSGFKGAASTTHLARRTLQFLDRQGAALMDFEEPLRPADAYAVFLQAVPVWSGHEVRPGKSENGGPVLPP